MARGGNYIARGGYIGWGGAIWTRAVYRVGRGIYGPGWQYMERGHI